MTIEAGTRSVSSWVRSRVAALGAPVAEPSDQLPGQVHWQDGLAMTFWRYYEQDRDVRVPCAAIADLLRELHRALRSFPGALPDFRARLVDARAIFDAGHSRRRRRRDRDFLIEEHDRLRAELDRLEPRLQLDFMGMRPRIDDLALTLFYSRSTGSIRETRAATSAAWLR